jgi:hypothetical protein
MHHRTYAVRVDADTGQRLARLQRRSGTPVRKLVNALLRDFLDAIPDPRCRRRVRQRR